MGSAAWWPSSESVLVRYDYASAAAVPLSPAHVAAIEAYEGHTLRPVN